MSEWQLVGELPSLVKGPPRTISWVTDPAPTRQGDESACQFKLYPTPDEVEFCDQPAIAVITTPCCGQTTNVCNACIGKMPTLGTWLCLGCGVKTDCQWTPIPFGIRWL